MRNFVIMKNCLYALAALLLLCSCQPAEVSSIQLNKHELFLGKAANEVLTVTFTPANAKDKSVTWASSNPAIATVADGIVVGVTPGVTEIVAKCGDALDKCRVTVLDAVDLGIVMTKPDGTRYALWWAASNLCRTGLCANPEDYGDYFAWGDVEPYYTSTSPFSWKTGKEKGYDWPSYKWAKGDGKKLTKYCPKDKTDYWGGSGAPDGLLQLEKSNDAASQILKGTWRLPTAEEGRALKNQCEWTWVNQKGVLGRRGTAANGNSIFFPAAGAIGGIHYYYVGECAYFWTSTLNTEMDSYMGPNGAYAIYISDQSNPYVRREFRDTGASIRPVLEVLLNE